jgi:hypothetical protein
MHARRIIFFPLLAVLAVLLVGAVIDAGRAARTARAAGGPGSGASTPADPALTAESERIQLVLAAARDCSGSETCSAEATAARIRRAAARIDTWPYDRRFQQVRSTLREQLLLDAVLLDARSLHARSNGGGAVQRARLEQLERRAADAAITAARAQRAAGLIDRAAYDARVDELRR